MPKMITVALFYFDYDEGRLEEAKKAIHERIVNDQNVYYQVDDDASLRSIAIIYLPLEDNSRSRLHEVLGGREHARI